MDVYLDALDHNVDGRCLLNEEDLDADLNYLNSSSTFSSAYKEITLFHEFSNNLKFLNQLRLGHLNFRSLSNKLPEISLLLAQTKLSVLALTETWLNNDQASSINLPGFTFVHRSRVSGIRGGVGFFISLDIEFCEVEEAPRSKNNTFESIIIKLPQKTTSDIILGSIYRPLADSILEFTSAFEHLLNDLTKTNKKLFISGDFNINLLLFILYVNDIQTITDLSLIMFAVDTNIFATDYCPLLLSNTLNVKLQSISEWFSANLLSLNLNKTCFMIFTKRKFPIATEMITINGVALQRVRETKFLGVVISDDLKWKKQVDVVVQKVSKVVGILYGTCHVLDKDRLKLLYSTLLEPYITYCCSVWSSPYKNGNLDRLLKLQKAAVRIISHSSYLAHSDPLFSSLKIIKMYDLTHLAVLAFMYRAVNDLLPKKFSSVLKTVNQVHAHDTRNSTNYVVPYARTGFRAASIQVLGPSLWNSLSEEQREAKSINLFKKKMKLSYLQKYNLL